MNRLILPAPPNPDDQAYVGNLLAWCRAQYRWMAQVKSKIEDNSRLNSAPAGQQIIVGSFTTNTQISGTTTGTDLTDFVASLAQTLTQKGILAPTSTKGNS